MPNIALDIDDVLLENTAAFIDFLRENKGIGKNYSDFRSRRLWEYLNISKDECFELINAFYLSPFFRYMNSIDGSQEVVSRIKNNYSVYIVTNRPLSTKEITTNQLSNFFGNAFEDIIFAGQFQKEKHELSSKIEIVQDVLKAKFFIEDDIDIIEQLDTAIVQPIIYAQPWNRDTDAARFEKWSEIGEYLHLD